MSRRAAAARQPRALPAATWTALLLAVCLIGVGVVAVHDLATSRGWASGASWTGTVVDRADGLTADTRVMVAGIVAVVVGELLVLFGLRPARRTHRASGTEGVWVSDDAVSALAGSAARDVAGVADARVSVGRRRVTVTVRGSRDGVADDVESVVRGRLAGLSTSDVVVRARRGDS